MGEDADGGAAAPAGRRRRRRSVGPAGATPPGSEPRLDLAGEPTPRVDDDEHLRRDRPPHHDQGV